MRLISLLLIIGMFSCSKDNPTPENEDVTPTDTIPSDTVTKPSTSECYNGCITSDNDVEVRNLKCEVLEFYDSTFVLTYKVGENDATDYLIPCELPDSLRVSGASLIISGYILSDCCGLLTHENFRQPFGCKFKIIRFEED